MRIAIVGGGPGGLYFAALTKQLSPDHTVTVWERNAADDTFGFGVVFSDETLGGIEHADEAIYAQMEREFATWDDIDVHAGGTVHTSGGHGFAAMSRRRLLEILQQRCRALGVRLHFGAPAPDVAELSRTHDLVVAADGVNSTVRGRYADTFQPTVDIRHCKYMWLGTDKVFDAFKFYIRETPYGVMQIHGYPYDAKASTFIVEMNESVWQRAGFAALAGAELAPGQSDERSAGLVRELFADILDGHEVLLNNSRWVSFATVRNERWRHGNVVLLGDAAHTAHFSIGSGTKLAMEDALALAACLHEQAEVGAALQAYEEERRPVVLSTQRAAQASLEWFENLGQYTGQDPVQFAFNIITRSRRVTYDNLRVRDPEFVASVDRWFARHEAARGMGTGEVRPPMFQPFRLRDMELVNRVVVSPMDMYVAEDGRPGDFHLVHLGGKALGGAGLVMTEMVCVSADGRITPGCTGIYTDEQAGQWRRITEFVHRESQAKIGLQLGHSGRKGSTRLMWEGMDQPLPAGNWPVVGPSPLPYRPGVSQVPHELTGAELDVIRQQFADAAARADQAGFDLLELHCAHGYLLSSFISPLTNQRRDEYGGSLDGRLRYPLEVLRRDPGGVAGGQAGQRADLGHRLAGRRHHRRGLGAHRTGVRGGGRGHHRRLDRAGHRGGAARVRPVIPDPVRRPDPQPGGYPNDGRGHHLVLRRRQLAAAGRPGRPVRAGPGASVRPELDAARRGGTGLRRAGRGLAAAVAGGRAAAADRPGGGAEAAAGAGPAGPPRHWASRHGAPALGTDLSAAVH